METGTRIRIQDQHRPRVKLPMKMFIEGGGEEEEGGGGVTQVKRIAGKNTPS